MTRPLWPVHLKPLPDELLSSWLVRLAHAHGLKVQTFCRLLFGSKRQLWNRDIDRLAPDWLLIALCWNTATPMTLGAETTLRRYEGVLYRDFRESSILQWILPLKIYHRTRMGYGQQFCHQCLADDNEPYFRKRWRVAFCTYCAIHNTMLHDRCPNCGAPVIFQRRELGHPNLVDGGSVTLCYSCGFDLRESGDVSPVFYEESAHGVLELAIRRLEYRGPWFKPRSVRYYNVLHHLCRLLAAEYRHVQLRQFACRLVGAPDMSLSPNARVFEMRSVQERHHLMQLAFWYMADLEPRLTAAWHDGGITYSALLRDFDDRPGYYDAIVAKFSDWRTRGMQPNG